MLIRKREINTRLEKQIAAGLILSKDFCQQVEPIYQMRYFENEHLRIISSWAVDFYREHKKAIQSEIESVLEISEIDESDEKMIRAILEDMDKRYHGVDTINIDYLLDETTTYFEKRELTLTAKEILQLCERDEISRAREATSKSREVRRAMTNWQNLTDEENINLVFREEHDFFKFPGALGEFVGNLKRGWLVALEGQFKRGKTWLLQEFAVNAMLSKLNVAFFSLEMTRQQMFERLYRRLNPGLDKPGTITRPVFDCYDNQTGACRLKQRASKFSLLQSDGTKPKFDPRTRYVPCTYCRNRKKISDNYQMAVWQKEIKLPEFDPTMVRRRINVVKKNYGDRIKISIFPRFSANTTDIRRELDILSNEQEFIPDVIVIDYADILRPESKNDSGVEKEDITWMSLAQLAGERQALVVTATQVNKAGQNAESLSIKHTAKWIGKFGHVDAMYTINQTEAEKEEGVLRIGTLAHRHKEFSTKQQCTILQNLSIGQVHFDSEWGFPYKPQKDDNKVVNLKQKKGGDAWQKNLMK